MWGSYKYMTFDFANVWLWGLVKVSAQSFTAVVEHGESHLTKLQRVSDRALQKHSNRVKATPGQQYSSRGHTGGSRSWNLPHFYTKLCTYILDIVSGNGRVVMINRPFGYNYDIQPFHPCSVLQGGVVERQHDRKTKTVAVTWSFRSTAARRCKQPRSWGQILLEWKIVFALRNQQYPDDLIECLHRTSRLRRDMDLFYTHINILLNILMPIIMTEKLQGNCPTANLGYLQHCWFPSVESPCFWLPLSLHSGTHILDKTRGYRLPMPVNGSLRNYDYIQPCAPGTGLNHEQ